MKPNKPKRTTTPPPGLLRVRPFPKKGVTSPETFHDLGPVVIPADQAAALGAHLPTNVLETDARKLLVALNGSGPRQEPPHTGTAFALDEALSRLRDHALAGDADAFANLGFILRNAVADFHEIARLNPALAAAWGERQNTIPALTGRNPGHAADLNTAFTLFNLGEKSPYRVNSEHRKAPSAITRSNALAAALCAHLNAHRFAVELMRPPVPPWAGLAAKLPELDASTAHLWTKAAFELLESSVENEAELLRLSDLGDVREHDTKKGTSSQREAIKARLRRAMSVIAAKKAPPSKKAL